MFNIYRFIEEWGNSEPPSVLRLFLSILSTTNVQPTSWAKWGEK